MASFTVRVELHGVRHDDDIYEVLHSAMAREGFSRTILGGDGKTYHMPPAEYNLIANQTSDNVRAAAVRAAAVTKKRAAVLVTEGTRCWQGLDEVN